MPDLLELPENRQEVELLRAAGHELATDEDLVAAFSVRLHCSRSTARLALSPGPCDDVVTVDLARVG